MSEVDDKLSTSMRRHSLRLGVFALGTALLLSLVSLFTADRITLQRLQAEREALNAVLPPTAHDNDMLDNSFTLTPDTTEYSDIALLGLSTARQAYTALQANKVSGVILPVETPDGYSGTIVLLVGLDHNGGITGVRVLQHAETPGLGDKVETRKSSWILGFDQLSLNNTDTPLWRVKKDGGEFDQFVGATITPRAVVAAVHNALLFFEANKIKLTEVNHGK